MAYSKSQKKLAKKLIKIGKKRGESKKEIKSALATAIVEANLSNPRGGHGTSAGWRQEIDSYGSVKNRTNIRKSANRYYDETSAALKQNPNLSVGQLSQAVQRSAYPSRYGEVSGQAGKLLSKLGGQGVRSAPGASKANQRKALLGGADVKAQKQDLQQALLNFVQTEDKDFTDYLAIYEQEQALEQAKQQQVQMAGVGIKKKGKQKQSSRITLPDNEKKAIIQLGKLAQKMGLSVREQSHFDPVDPVHTSGSFHYKDRAIDVSGDPKRMAKFANVVAKRYGKGLAELFWNGRKAVNIDEGKQVGKGYVSGHKDHVHVAI